MRFHLCFPISLLLAAVPLALLPIAGCGSGGGNSPTASPTSSSTRSVVGSWVQTELATENQTTTCAGAVDLGDGTDLACGENTLLVFKSDETFDGLTVGKPESGTYSYDPSAHTLFRRTQVGLTDIIVDSTVSVSFSAGAGGSGGNGDTMTFSYVRYGHTVRETYRKQ